MKKFGLMILILFLSLSFQAIALEECLSGSWYSPERTGEGIALEVFDEQTLGYFYTYGSQGRAWYVMVSEDIETKPDTDLLVMYGTTLVSKTPYVVRESDVGLAFITVIDNDTIQFKYSLVLDVDRAAAIPWCLAGFCDGDYTYQRLTQPISCD